VSHFYIVWQGADLMAGSLIKNPGGTIAPCGGYVAGKKKLVEAAAARLSAPGLGVDCGSTPGDIMRAFFQGLFLSPQMVGEAIKVLDFFISLEDIMHFLLISGSESFRFLYKGSYLIAEVLASKGYKVQPLPRVPRCDTVQVFLLNLCYFSF
jgi:cystathionine beta-lyase family protein involved in aluminum resistance